MDDKLQQRLDALEANEAKKKRIFGAVTAVLILLFLGGILLGIQNVLLAEGTEAIPAPAPEMQTEQPETPQDIVGYYQSLLEDAAQAGEDGRVKLNVSTALSVDEDGMTFTPADDALREVLCYADDDVLAGMRDIYPDEDFGFGKDFSARLPSSFTAEDLLQAKCETEEETGMRTLRFTFPESDFYTAQKNRLGEIFDLSRAAKNAAAIETSFADVAEAVEALIICRGFSVEAQADGKSDRLEKLVLTRRYDADLRIAFTGALAALGRREMQVTFTATETYTFTWAGLTLSTQTLWTERGKTEHIEVFRVADGDVEVCWESSDPSIAEVDDEGYVKGRHVSAEPVTVTAAFDYLGHTYTAECEVWVRRPVKKAVPKQREVTLRQGGQTPLQLKITPGRATVRDAYWTSSDPSVVTVSEQGEVLGVKPGSAEVVAITRDGNYKATFTVTVEGGDRNG